MCGCTCSSFIFSFNRYTSCLLQWDVTDKDIDKLSMQCMQSTFDPFRSEVGPSSLKTKQQQEQDNNNAGCEDSSGSSEMRNAGDIAASLSVARKVCKLQHAVGCAPVIYGIPLRFSLWERKKEMLDSKKWCADDDNYVFVCKKLLRERSVSCHDHSYPVRYNGWTIALFVWLVLSCP